MKFQKDNINTALTQEIKDAHAKKIKDQQEAEEKSRREAAEKVQRRMKVNLDYKRATEPMQRRIESYPPINEQLDMLFHDMESGAIKVDKRKDSWYKTIKKIKESTPLPENWLEDLETARARMYLSDEELANTNIEGV